MINSARHLKQNIGKNESSASPNGNAIKKYPEFYCGTQGLSYDYLQKKKFELAKA